MAIPGCRWPKAVPDLQALMASLFVWIVRHMMVGGISALVVVTTGNANKEKHPKIPYRPALDRGRTFHLRSS